jgi:two-component system sensor histidine kinase UhpB
VLECAETTRHALERVRQLSLSLRPLQLDDLGLVAALRSHLDRQAGIGGLTPHFDALEAPHSLAAEVETACFRVAQEAVTNVLRHAQAKNVWLRLFTAGEYLALSVRDDGVGFDLEAARRRGAAGASLGLVGMEQRAALAGGTLELRSAPGQGTLLLATFALQARQKEPDR